MKKRSREINVFSVSALDLFASALGAFILMSLVFMVFFSMTSRDSGESIERQAALERCEVELSAAHARRDELMTRNDVLQTRLEESVEASSLQQCQSQLDATRAALRLCETNLEAAGGAAVSLEHAEEELDACRRALQQTFVLIIASWGSRDDVDLHVVDPAGREFYYQNRRQSGTPAALEEDNTFGPGNEVWLHPAAEPGRYRVCYKLFRGSRTRVRGSVLWQDGKTEIPDLTLSGGGQVQVAVDVVVDDQGRVSLDRARTGQVLGSEGCG